MFDISSISQVATSNDGQDLELRFNNEHVATVTVLGSHSDAVRSFTDLKLIEFARTQALSKNKGVDAEINYATKMVHERDSRSVDAAFVRTKNWRINQETVKVPKDFVFTDEIAKQWLTNNPSWRDQIFEFSEELGK